MNFSSIRCTVIKPNFKSSLNQIVKWYSAPASALKPSISESDNMTAWQISSYGDINNLNLCENTPVPTIQNSNEVLIKVAAASLNPLDLEMISGFGSVLLKNMKQMSTFYRQNPPSLPLILGRDFSGIVIGKGSAVTNVNVGDEVYGVVKPMNQGCFSQYTVTEDYLVSKKPEHLTFEEACGICYTGVTAWCALKVFGGLSITSAKGKRVLVIGSAGGVGISAVQLLNAWGAEVISVCSKNAVPTVVALTPEHIIDYTQPDYYERVRTFGKYDIILDAAGLGEDRLHDLIPVMNSCGSIITLKSPLLPNIDKYGLIGGTIKSAFDITLPNLTSGVLKKCGLIKWGFFIPLSSAINEVTSLTENKKIKPIIQNVYEFDNLPEAFERMKQGHVHGKLIIFINSSL